VLILVVSVDYNRNGLMGGYFLQEGFARLWRGTNAGLALAVPTVSSYFMLFFFFFSFFVGVGGGLHCWNLLGVQNSVLSML
jgi:hypothetical protein